MTLKLKAKHEPQFLKLAVQFISIAEREGLPEVYGQYRTRINQEKEAILQSIDRILDEYNAEKKKSSSNTLTSE